MATYLHPGVYVEEIPSGSKPIEGVGTSTAVFIGYTTKGPMGEPELIFKWDDYVNTYGGIRDTKEERGDPMGFSVLGFFQNGGTAAYIVRLAQGAKKAEGFLLKDEDSVIRFTASTEGQWGNRLIAKLAKKETGGEESFYILQIGKEEGGKFTELEMFTDLSMESDNPQYIEHKVNDASELIEVEVIDKSIDVEIIDKSLDLEPIINLSGGKDGEPPQASDYQGIFSKLCKYRDINIVSLPGQHWDKEGNNSISAAISHAETMKGRMVIIDPPPSYELETEKMVNELVLPSSTYSVLYYPWLKVSNPFYHPESNPGAPWTVLIPPCGFAAGIWAKTDSRRGVWKAPAGVETNLLGVARLEFIVEDGEQDQLNPLGVNCLRKLPGFGHVIWGTRTLSTKANPEWRYVPIRRTAIMIEQSIYNGIQWAVFEPNDHRLWSALRLNIDSFMNGLFRAGAFQGETVSDAYFVRCGLGDTMTQGDIDHGQVIVIVGFAPLKPAEFVIVRIQQKVGQH